MLLVCNGAQKSGSTWLYNILTSLVDCKEPDPKYLTGASKNPCIAPGKLESFLQNVDFVAKLMAYHELWRNSGVRCHVASFEGLKNTFPSEVRGIVDTLGITLSDQEIEQLYEATNMDKLRKKYAKQELYADDRFSRKGIFGDWENWHLGPLV